MQGRRWPEGVGTWPASTRPSQKTSTPLGRLGHDSQCQAGAGPAGSEQGHHLSGQGNRRPPPARLSQYKPEVAAGQAKSVQGRRRSGRVSQDKAGTGLAVQGPRCEAVQG